MRLIDADAIPYTMLYKENCLNGTGVEAQGVFKSDIDNMPTIEERKTGTWEEREVCDDPNVIEEWQSARCSNCGLYHTTPYMYHFDNYKYCPNCGAKMGGVEE